MKIGMMQEASKSTIRYVIYVKGLALYPFYRMKMEWVS